VSENCAITATARSAANPPITSLDSFPVMFVLRTVGPNTVRVAAVDPDVRRGGWSTPRSTSWPAADDTAGAGRQPPALRAGELTPLAIDPLTLSGGWEEPGDGMLLRQIRGSRRLRCLRLPAPQALPWRLRRSRPASIGVSASPSVLAAGGRAGYLGYTECIMGKVLVSFDDALLRRIDRAASSRGLTRSAYLAQLAERDAARATGPGKTPAVQAALRELDRLFADAPPGESTAAIRAGRASR
jgi:hypothetical protein